VDRTRRKAHRAAHARRGGPGFPSLRARTSRRRRAAARLTVTDWWRGDSQALLLLGVWQARARPHGEPNPSKKPGGAAGRTPKGKEAVRCGIPWIRGFPLLAVAAVQIRMIGLGLFALCSNPGFVPLRDTREPPKSIHITILSLNNPSLTHHTTTPALLRQIWEHCTALCGLLRQASCSFPRHTGVPTVTLACHVMYLNPIERITTCQNRTYCPLLLPCRASPTPTEADRGVVKTSWSRKRKPCMAIDLVYGFQELGARSNYARGTEANPLPRPACPGAPLLAPRHATRRLLLRVRVSSQLSHACTHHTGTGQQRAIELGRPAELTCTNARPGTDGALSPAP